MNLYSSFYFEVYLQKKINLSTQSLLFPLLRKPSYWVWLDQDKRLLSLPPVKQFGVDRLTSWVEEQMWSWRGVGLCCDEVEGLASLVPLVLTYRLFNIRL